MYRLQLDNLSPNCTEERLRQHFATYNKKSKQKIRFSAAEIIPERLTDNSQSCFLTFESRSSLEEAASQLISGHLMDKRELKLRIQVSPQDKSAFTRETSLMVRQLDYRVIEQELIVEIGVILNANRVYRGQILKWEQHQLRKQGLKIKPKKVVPFFLLSCTVLRRATGESRGLALVDLNCAEAANVVRNGLDRRKFADYCNELVVEPWRPQELLPPKDIKDEQPDQDKKDKDLDSVAAEQPCKLFVKHLPSILSYEEIYELLNEQGTILSLRLLPNRDQPDQFFATVTYKSRADALTARKKFDGRQIIPGTAPVHLDFFNPDNRFPATQIGITKHQLMTNTHYRILFLSGIDYRLSKFELTEICEKYGKIDHITLKSSLDQDGQKHSRGIAIVQYSTVEEAGLALKKLVFEEALGDPCRVRIEFYESHESRMQSDYGQRDPVHELRVTEEFAQPLLYALKEQALDQLLTGQSSASTADEPIAIEDFECPEYLIRPIQSQWSHPPASYRQPNMFRKDGTKKVWKPKKTQKLSIQTREVSERRGRSDKRDQITEPIKVDKPVEDDQIVEPAQEVTTPVDAKKPSKLHDFAYAVDKPRLPSWGKEPPKPRLTSQDKRSRSPSTHVITTDYLRYLHKSPRRDSVSPVTMLGRNVYTDDQDQPIKLVDALKKRESTINEEESFFENSATSPRLYELSGKKLGSAQKSDPIISDTGSGLDIKRIAGLNASDEKRSTGLPGMHVGSTSNFLAMLGHDKSSGGDAKSSPLHKKDVSTPKKYKVKTGFLGSDEKYSPQDVPSGGSFSDEKAKSAGIKKIASMGQEQSEQRGRARHTREAIAKWQWDAFSESQQSEVTPKKETKQ